VVKDLFPRFQTMRGKRVARRPAGHHGLAVEIEVEKRLGISGKKEIEQLVPGDPRASIERFNRACFDSVMTYERQWRADDERVGYWVDLDDAYFTYSNEYIESVWWSLKTLHDKLLLYEGHKSQPYCARCGYHALLARGRAELQRGRGSLDLGPLPGTPRTPHPDDRGKEFPDPLRLLSRCVDDDAVDDARHAAWQ